MELVPLGFWCEEVVTSFQSLKGLIPRTYTSEALLHVWNWTIDSRPVSSIGLPTMMPWIPWIWPIWVVSFCWGPRCQSFVRGILFLPLDVRVLWAGTIPVFPFSQTEKAKFVATYTAWLLLALSTSQSCGRARMI